MRDRIQNAAARAVLGAVLAVPYRARVPMMGWLAAHVLGPALGWRRRIRANLAHVCPDLDPAEVRRLTRAVPDNVGRTLIEIYSGAEFKARVGATPLRGAGVAPLRAAVAAGRPVIIVTAHMGNFDALRAALFAQGIPVAGLYRAMNNAAFNAHYVAALSQIGTPVYPTDRRGVLRFIQHLRAGNTIGILTDVYVSGGAPVTFFGQPAPTATSACDWALRFDALVVPCYGLRRPDGLSFDIRLEAPVPHSDALTMTQVIADDLERQVRARMDQWFWIHRRWKPARQARHRARSGAAGTAG